MNRRLTKAFIGALSFAAALSTAVELQDYE